MNLCQLPNLDSQDDDVCELQNYQNVIVSGSGHCEIKAISKRLGFDSPPLPLEVNVEKQNHGFTQRKMNYGRFTNL